MTYEESLKRLEEIVGKLESGDLALEESLELFKEGSELAAKCKTTLENAKLRVKMISEGQDG
ncbi:MAG: exodeoxyribonuclease VII small subunit [Ruminococcus sp.]|nr:exodeoxyribonuclease VII small subunit [Ruminococcus sp.]